MDKYLTEKETIESAYQDLFTYYSGGCYSGENGLGLNTTVIALNAVGKLIPMKPIRVTDELIHCKKCGNAVRNGHKWCDEYCDHCGQKIDW